MSGDAGRLRLLLPCSREKPVHDWISPPPTRRSLHTGRCEHQSLLAPRTRGNGRTHSYLATLPQPQPQRRLQKRARPFIGLRSTHTRMDARMHTRTDAHLHARTHAQTLTCTQTCSQSRVSARPLPTPGPRKSQLFPAIPATLPVWMSRLRPQSPLWTEAYSFSPSTGGASTDAPPISPCLKAFCTSLGGFADCTGERQTPRSEPCYSITARIKGNSILT